MIKSRDIGPFNFIVGDCRTDRLSWFSFGPSRSSRGKIQGFSMGGPKHFVAVFWMPRVYAESHRDCVEAR